MRCSISSPRTGCSASRGLAAYRAHQRRREHVALAPGTAFPLVRALLGINEQSPRRLVEVLVISRNDADSGARILHSIEQAGLDISRAAFTDGREPWPYLRAFQCNLFLSAEPSDVEAALAAGVPAAVVSAPPDQVPDEPADEVRVAFDGDAVLFDAASERLYQQEGLAAFQAHEAERAEEPLSSGPFEPFLRALKHVQGQFPEERAPIRIALVTARGAPAHRRVINTLRSWGARGRVVLPRGCREGPGARAVSPPHLLRRSGRSPRTRRTDAVGTGARWWARAVGPVRRARCRRGRISRWRAGGFRRARSHRRASGEDDGNDGEDGPDPGRLRVVS
nr:5'-nucleotidase [Egibacter rhizosphaerae]